MTPQTTAQVLHSSFMRTIAMVPVSACEPIARNRKTVKIATVTLVPELSPYQLDSVRVVTDMGFSQFELTDNTPCVNGKKSYTDRQHKCTTNTNVRPT